MTTKASLLNESGIVKRVFGLPQTRAGRVAVNLCVLFFVLFAAWISYMELWPMSRPTFLSDPIHVVLILGAAGSAIVGGFLGGLSLVMRREKSILTILSFIVGAIVLCWTVAEIIGH